MTLKGAKNSGLIFQIQKLMLVLIICVESAATWKWVRVTCIKFEDFALSTFWKILKQDWGTRGKSNRISSILASGFWAAGAILAEWKEAHVANGLSFSRGNTKIWICSAHEYDACWEHAVKYNGNSIVLGLEPELLFKKLGNQQIQVSTFHSAHP